MVGVKQSDGNGNVAPSKNYNKNTSHFVVISSMSKVDGKVNFGYYDNANTTLGKSSDNQFIVDVKTGEMQDCTNLCVGGVKKFTVSEVRQNK